MSYEGAYFGLLWVVESLISSAPRKVLSMEEYLTRSESNESRLSALKDEIKTFKLALSTLKSREEVLEREEQSLAT